MTNFEEQESWFRLFSVTAFAFLPIVLAPIVKMGRTFDKKAGICRSPFRYVPGIFPIVLFSLIHLGLFTSGLFIHANESTPSNDEYFLEINVLVYTAGLLLALCPHVYTLNWYDYRKHMKYRFSKSWGIMTAISGILTPIIIFTVWALLLVAIILVGIDERWTAFGIYLAYEVALTVVFLYLLLELIWCANAYRKFAMKSGKSGITVLLVMEEATKKPTSKTQLDVELTQGDEKERARQYGMKKRRGYDIYQGY